jgi:hypothetical protein
MNNDKYTDELVGWVDVALADLRSPCAICKVSFGRHSLGQLNECFKKFAAERDALLAENKRLIKTMNEALKLVETVQDNRNVLEAENKRLKEQINNG